MSPVSCYPIQKFSAKIAVKFCQDLGGYFCVSLISRRPMAYPRLKHPTQRVTDTISVTHSDHFFPSTFVFVLAFAYAFVFAFTFAFGF